MGLANKITIIRILLVPVLLCCFLYYRPEYDYLRFWALGIFFICAITDAIDGYVARKFYQKTEIGKILDPLADKFLLLASFLSLSAIRTIPAASKIPLWLTTMVISRDVIILLGALIIFLMVKKLEIKPSILGKATTFTQMATIIAALLQITDHIIFLWLATAFFTAASGFGYILYGNRILNNEQHRT